MIYSSVITGLFRKEFLDKTSFDESAYVIYRGQDSQQGKWRVMTGTKRFNTSPRYMHSSMLMLNRPLSQDNGIHINRGTRNKERVKRRFFVIKV